MPVAKTYLSIYPSHICLALSHSLHINLVYFSTSLSLLMRRCRDIHGVSRNTEDAKRREKCSIYIDIQSDILSENEEEILPPFFSSLFLLIFCCVYQDASLSSPSSFLKLNAQERDKGESEFLSCRSFFLSFLCMDLFFLAPFFMYDRRTSKRSFFRQRRTNRRRPGSSQISLSRSLSSLCIHT